MCISSAILRILYFSGSHPVLLISVILLQAVILCLIGWLKLKIRWFSYILFLIFLGGLIVLFIYITSLASNEKINISLINQPAHVFYIFTAVVIFLLIKINFQHQFLQFTETQNKFFNFMYRINRIYLTLITIIYLLLTLIIVVKTSNKFEAPLKNKIFK